MFGKRTRLYTNFDLISLLYILKNFFLKKKNFQNKLRKYLNEDNVILTSLGRTALYDIIKLIISSKKKKKFFISPFTIPAVIHAINYAGGEIVYIDMNKETGLIDEKLLNDKIDDNTAGVIITHLYSNQKNIREFIERFKHKILIIEDAAINFGSKVNGQHLGTLGDFGFFSFNVVKNLNTLNGGAIYIKDKDYFDKYVTIRKTNTFSYKLTFNLILTALIMKIFFNNFSYQIFHYFLKIVYAKKINFILKRIYPILFHKYDKEIPNIYSYDFNWLMNEIGNYNLDKIDNDFEKRLKKAKLYFNLISDNVAHKTSCFEGENSLLEYAIILKEIDNYSAHKILMQNGYDIRHTWYINNAKYLKNFSSNEYKNTEIIEKKILCLPLHKNINTNDIEKICKIINNF